METVAGLLVLALVWGTQYLVIRAGLATLPPLTTAALRFGVVAVAAQIILLFRPSRVRPPLGQRAVYGLSHAASMGLLYWAQARLDSALMGTLVALTPILVALTAHLFVANEKFEPKVVLATAVGFAGVATIAWGATRHASTPNELSGVLAAVASSAVGAVTGILAKRLTVKASAPLLLRDFGVAVALSLATVALVIERPTASGFTAGAIASFLYLGLVGSAGATGLYLVILRRVSIARMGYLQFASAVVALTAGVLIGRETLTAADLGGATLVLCGLGIVKWSPSRATVPKPA